MPRRGRCGEKQRKKGKGGLPRDGFPGCPSSLFYPNKF